MADRTKERKGARKTAASKPKAEARVAAAGRPVGLPVGGGITEPVPFEGMSGMGTIVPVPSDQPPPRDLRATEQIPRAWEEPPVAPPQAGILGATATAVANFPAQPLIQAEIQRASATDGVAADVQQAPTIIPGAGGVQADADRVPARTRKRTTGTRPARRVTIAAIRRQTAVAEPALKKLAPAHGGIGHNRQRRANRGAPLTRRQYDRAVAAIGRLWDALKTGVASRAAIAAMKAAARTLGNTVARLDRWLKLREAAVEFTKSFGKTAGKTAGSLAPAVIVSYAIGAHGELTTLIQMIVLIQMIDHRTGRK
jgi:hypothetical protein